MEDFGSQHLKTLHWEGNQSRLPKFCGRLYEVHDGVLRIFNLGTHEWLVVPVGSWIFKLQNGDVFVVAHEAVKLWLNPSPSVDFVPVSA